MIPIYFNIELAIGIESKQKNVKNVNRFKKELCILYWLLVVNGSSRYRCTKCPQLFLLGTQYSLI